MVTVIFWQQKQNSFKNIFMAIVWKSKEKSWMFLYTIVMLNTIVEQNKVSGKVKFSPFRSSVY